MLHYYVKVLSTIKIYIKVSTTSIMKWKLLGMILALCAVIAAVVALLTAHGLTVATAESCTGGMIATALTEVPGASQVFRYGWVTYCNEAKERLLNVPAELIEENLHRTYRLPMRETLRCLNLSNAVAIVTYEVLRSWDFEGLV